MTGHSGRILLGLAMKATLLPTASASLLRDRQKVALSPRTAAALFLLFAALLLRSSQFGNAQYGDDEQFYLLVGDQFRHGALPYVDIFDRKPIGLFVLFAGIRLLGGDGILIAQLVATLFAAVTACLVMLIAHRNCAIVPATLAGLFYILMLGILAGDTTQAAVFYNLPTVAAAWLLLDTNKRLDNRGAQFRAAAAMLLLGLAIQIKTTAVFEGAALGLWLTHRMLVAGVATRTVLHRASVLAMIALFPTIVAATVYAGLGHFDAWWFANVVSQLRKTGGLGHESLLRLATLGPMVCLMAVIALFGLRRLPQGDHRSLAAWWLVATLVDVFAIGNFWPQYAQPMLLPVSILFAQVFALPRRTALLFGIVAAYPLLDALVLDRIQNARDSSAIAAAMKLMPKDAGRECLLSYDAPEIYYYLTGACLVTPYAFVDQLRSSTEANALPEDASVALRKALAQRPGTVLTVAGSQWRLRNEKNDRIIAAALAQGYRPVGRSPMRNWPPEEKIIVWRRNDLPPR